MTTGKAATNAVIYDSILDLIGNTPMVRLHRLPGDNSAEILAKLEAYNPGWSVKDRIALAMIEAAEKSGALKPGGVIIEPTSGNTGIGLAMVAAVKGYRCILAMPDSMTLERRFAVESFGAEIVLTPAAEGMNGAVNKAKELLAQTPGAFMPQQFENPANPEVHRRTTAREIIAATGGKLDAFVAGIGTGGTLTGVGEVLRQEGIKAQIVAVEPASSPLLSKGEAGKHMIQGIGANFVPGVLNRDIIDRIIPVADEDAFRTARKLATTEGIFCGISAGAACFAALQVAKELGKGKRVVVILPDLGERYASLVEKFRV
jgi:cysteine synthase